MDVRLPRLGEGADSGTVASIFVKEGDQVKKDQPVIELESEKAVASIPSPAAGTVTKLHVKEGDAIKVGQLIFSLSEAGDTAAVSTTRNPVIDASVGDEEAEGAPPVTMEAAYVPEPELPVDAAAAETGPPPASPSIRKMARDLGIDLTKVKGSERGGRIVLDDLRHYILRLQQVAAQPKPSTQTIPVTTTPAPEQQDFSRWGSVERKKMSTIRRTISTRMVVSWTTIPHITQFDEADVTGILTLKKKYAAAYEKKGAHLTLTAFALMAVAPLLKKHAIFNASIDELAAEIVYKAYVHVGIAVDTEQGLIVPVIRDVDRKSLFDLAKELNELAERTRQRKVSLDEMQGGSFTISNQGGIGSGHFTPIINKPESAILGIGRGTLKPIFPGSKMQEKRTMLPLSLSYDHRIIDGADAARFMVELVEAFQNFRDADVKL
jgi:pyruvate dehydrogenase E2 component (dihydrolipoamide acetyltransferase)